MLQQPTAQDIRGKMHILLLSVTLFGLFLRPPDNNAPKSQPFLVVHLVREQCKVNVTSLKYGPTFGVKLPACKKSL